MKQFSLTLPVLLLCVLFGCGSEKDVPEVMPHQAFASDSTEAPTSVFRATPAPISYPLEDAPALTLCYPLAADSLPQGDQQLLSAWEAATGIHVDANSIPADDYQMYLNLSLASDIMADLLYLTPEYFMNEDSDVLLELSDLISQYAPSYISAVNALDGGPQSAVNDSGEIYSLCTLMDQPALLSGFGLVLRQDWVEELGLPAPETYEDYHDLLLAIKDAYHPAQPLRLPESGVTGYNNFCAGFGISLGSRSANHGFYQVDGTVHFGPLEEGFTQYLTLLHQWYQEGIITIKFLDFTEYESNSYLIALSTGDCGAFFLPSGSYKTLEGMCSFPIAPAMDPVQVSGDTTHLAPSCATVICNQGYSITTYCGSPELAVEALDWLYTPEARALSAYGTEGISYELTDGQPAFTDLIRENPAAELPSYTAMTLGSCIAAESVQLLRSSDLLEVWNRQKDAAQMIPQFIIGERPLSEIPAVQEKIRNWDVDRCIQLWQTALDRAYAA